MKRILIISSSAESADALKALVLAHRAAEVAVATYAEEAQALISGSAFDIAIVNLPLEKGGGGGVINYMVEKTDISVIAIVNESAATDEFIEKSEKMGVIVVQKPVSRLCFFQALRTVDAMQNRVYTIITENEDLKEKLDDANIINRAKCTLIQYLGMSEEMAHHHIEKRAMDMRATKRQVAEMILRTYEQ